MPQVHPSPASRNPLPAIPQRRRAVRPPKPSALSEALNRLEALLGVQCGSLAGATRCLATARKVAVDLPEVESATWTRRLDVIDGLLTRAQLEVAAHEEAHRRFSKLFRAGEVAELPSIHDLMEQVLVEWLPRRAVAA